MNQPDYDVAITGAGPVGSALALLLAANAPNPDRIALVAPWADYDQASEGSDPRSLALNQGSRDLLEPLGAWPQDSADILNVHVSQRGRLGRTLITHEELGVPRLGSVVTYESIVQRLHQEVKQAGISQVTGQALDSAPGEPVQLHTDTGTVSCRVLVRSDGARPRGLQRDYAQHGVLATVRVSRPKVGTAYERFTREGPLALLPHPQGDNCYTLVWCCRPETALKLQKLSDSEFANALLEAFGERVGHFQLTTARIVVPLSLSAGPLLIDPYTVAVGNAAQTLHPVAGQGLNLGLRDAAQLASVLRPWLQQADSNPAASLQDFARRRRLDRWVTGALTDFLPRGFTTRNPIVEHTAGIALLTLDLFASLRAPLARQLLQGLRT